MKKSQIGIGAVLIAAAAPTQAQDERVVLAELLQAPIAIERTEDVSVIPTRLVFGKIALDASINGMQREFIFDTGSPTVISRQLADELGLETIATNRGRDANGAVVEMDFAIVETITLGGVTFRNVPVLIHDFTSIEMGACVFDGGVIGSELFPGSAWTLDTWHNEIRILSPDAERNSNSEWIITVPLQASAYPYAPVIRYELGEITDHALFDTGADVSVSLFEGLMEDESVQSLVDAESLQEGEGSMGVSAGGYGEDTRLLRFMLDGLKLGGATLDPLPATTRNVPPTLLGMGLLDRFIVTIDFPAGEMELVPAPYGNEPTPLRPGYAIGFRDGQAEIIQLFGGSRADRAGVRLGDVVLAIDDEPMVGLDVAQRCSSMRALAGGDLLRDAETLTIQRLGEEPQVVTLPEHSAL